MGADIKFTFQLSYFRFCKSMYLPPLNIFENYSMKKKNQIDFVVLFYKCTCEFLPNLFYIYLKIEITRWKCIVK